MQHLLHMKPCELTALWFSGIDPQGGTFIKSIETEAQMVYEIWPKFQI